MYKIKEPSSGMKYTESDLLFILLCRWQTLTEFLLSSYQKKPFTIKIGY